MMPQNIGIDICDDYITAYNIDGNAMFSVPTAICREKEEDTWYIGEEAYRAALSGKGVLTDKLVSLMKKHGTSTIQKQVYRAEELVSRLMYMVITHALGQEEDPEPGRVVVAIRKAVREEMDSVTEAMLMTGLPREAITVISHEEAFAHYVLAQDKSLSYNMAGAFDLSGENLGFCRLKVLRGGGRESVTAERVELEESFRIGILKNESGLELGDRILTEAARKYIGDDIYSSIFLTGKGFERTDWAKNFIGFICRKRKVMYENGLFAIGAALYAGELARNERGRQAIYCDTRVSAGISMSVVINERASKLIMVPAGTAWYETDIYAEVLPKGQDYIDIIIEPANRFGSRKAARIKLEGFPKRPDMCTRISVGLSFESAGRMQVSITDKGFGELFPATDAVIRQTVDIQTDNG